MVAKKKTATKRSNGTRLASLNHNTETQRLEPAMVDALESENADKEFVHQLPKGSTPLLSDLLPTYNTPRAYIGEMSEEMPAAVWVALNSDKKLSECRDPRLANLPIERLRGHAARLIAPPRAALVRRAASRNLELCCQSLDNLASDRPGQWKPVGVYRLQTVAELPHDHPIMPPMPDLTTEARARCEQLWNKFADRDVEHLWSPFNRQLFDATVAQAVDVECALYRTQGGSGVMWVRHHDFIFKVPGLVRSAGLRRPVEPEYTDQDKVDAMNRRTVTARSAG